MTGWPDRQPSALEGWETVRVAARAAVERIGLPRPKDEAYSWQQITEMLEALQLPVASSVRENLGLPGCTLTTGLTEELVELFHREEDAFGAMAGSLATRPQVHEVSGTREDNDFLRLVLPPTPEAGRADHLVVVRVAEGSTCPVLVEEWGEPGQGTPAGVRNSHIVMLLGKGSSVQVILPREKCGVGQLFSRVSAVVGEGASFGLALAEFGGSPVRHSLSVRLTGERASCDLRSLASLDATSQAHFRVRIWHEAPRCVSRQLYRNLLRGRSFAGMDASVEVARGARETDAGQLIRNLLLSPQARVAMKPHLRIFHDDVKASHGAATGAPDPEELFYLRSRGLSPDEALGLLAISFAAPALEQIRSVSLRQQLLAAVARPPGVPV